MRRNKRKRKIISSKREKEKRKSKKREKKEPLTLKQDVATSQLVNLRHSDGKERASLSYHSDYLEG